MTELSKDKFGINEIRCLTPIILTIMGWVTHVLIYLLNTELRKNFLTGHISRDLEREKRSNREEA